MSSYNKVILMGNLTRDCETRFTQNNVAIVKFGLAINRRFKGPDDEWKDEPVFVDITMFGKRGEAFAKFHGKGKPAFVEGDLRFDQWEDKATGDKRSKLYVVAESWEFVGASDQAQGGGQQQQGEPQGQAQGGGQQQQQGFGGGGGYSRG
jgi:single-strand DNA-binding protein